MIRSIINLWRRFRRALRRIRYRSLLPRHAPELDAAIKLEPFNCPDCSGRIVYAESATICLGRREHQNVVIHGEPTIKTTKIFPCGNAPDPTKERCGCGGDIGVIDKAYYCTGLHNRAEAEAFLAPDLPGEKLGPGVDLPRKPCGWFDSADNFGKTWV